MSSKETASPGAVEITDAVFFQPVPDDAYGVVAQTAAVLGEQYYPIGLQPISRDDVASYFRQHRMFGGQHEHDIASLERHERWFEPVASGKFSQFVVYGPSFPDNVRKDQPMFWHPAMHLNRAVADGDPRRVTNYRSALETGAPVGGDGEVDLEVLMRRCFATAMERRVLGGVGLAPSDPSIGPVTGLDMKNFEALGQEPPLVEPGELQNLIADYYGQIERQFPEMEAFRQTPVVTHLQRIK